MTETNAPLHSPPANEELDLAFLAELQCEISGFSHADERKLMVVLEAGKKAVAEDLRVSVKL